MSRLVEDIYPELSARVLVALFKKSIYSHSSFLRTAPEYLAKITGLSYGRIMEVKFRILSKFSSSLRFGHKYYDELIDHCAIMPSGIDNFDKLLDCGLITGNIYELCGFSGCGKTQICKTVTINVCKTSHQQVLYIDSKNNISAERFFQIAESMNVSKTDETLKKIHTCQVRTACDLLLQLHQLKLRIKNSKKKYLGFKLIVIDSLFSLFQEFQSSDEGLSILNNVASLLKNITQEYHMIVLLTNFVKKWTDEIETEYDEMVQEEIQQPGLGRYWSSVPDVRIMMKKLDNSDECILVILKSLNQPSGKSTKKTGCFFGSSTCCQFIMKEATNPYIEFQTISVKLP